MRKYLIRAIPLLVALFAVSSTPHTKKSRQIDCVTTPLYWFMVYDYCEEDRIFALASVGMDQQAVSPFAMNKYTFMNWAAECQDHTYCICAVGVPAKYVTMNYTLNTIAILPDEICIVTKTLAY